jgi:hypothetical protein
MPRKPTKKLLTTFDLRKTFGTYEKLEKALTDNNIPFRKESGSYGGGGKVFYLTIHKKAPPSARWR